MCNKNFSHYKINMKQTSKLQVTTITKCQSLDCHKLAV